MAEARRTIRAPVLILKEGTTRQRGREAQRQNILAARIIAEMLKSTLGPRGMDKMLVDSIGDITITNDGATIMDEIEAEHPAAKVLVNVAKTQDKEVGDGTTTVVVLTGALLKKAEELLDRDIHPTIITAGFRRAESRAQEVLERIAQPIDLNDRNTLLNLASTSMRSKSIEHFREHFANIAVDAVLGIIEDRDGKKYADIDNIQVIKKPGKSLAETQLIRGLIIDKEVVHPGMPKRIEDAKIALLNCPLEIEKTEFSAEIRIRDPTQMKAFLDEEARMLREMVDKISGAGANVVFCQKGIDDMAQYFLAKKGILAVRRVKKSDMEKLSRATGARIVTNVDDLRPEDLGSAELVEERKIGEDRMVFVEGCKDPRAVAVLVRGGFERAVDEAERSLHDALSVVADVVRDPRIIYGGGAAEAEIAKEIRRFASQVGGREQLAIQAFAEAVEMIPQALAENAGLDPIDILVELRAKHEEPEGYRYGVDVFSGKVADMKELNVVEPLLVKSRAISAAVEAAITILRVDDIVIASKPLEKGKKAEEKPPSPPEFD